MNAVCNPQNSLQYKVLRVSDMFSKGRNIKCNTVDSMMINRAHSAWDSAPAVVKNTLTVMTAAFRRATTVSQ